MIGTISIDQQEYLFMGNKENIGKLSQIACDIDAMSTTYLFANGQVELKLIFTTPLLLEDLKLLSRPVSYLKAEIRSLDNQKHEVELKIRVEDDICLNTPKEAPTIGEVCEPGGEIPCARMGNAKQSPLNKAGDDVRIDWGYFYLAVNSKNSKVLIHKVGENTALEAQANLNTVGDTQALFTFAYDDICSLQYFGENIKGYWTKETENILELIKRSIEEYEEVYNLCCQFSDNLALAAKKSGGDKYCELLMLAYRQVIAAHKLGISSKGELLFVSKECFSNGCAATVDVTYPSIPLFLLYNPELIKGMLNPIFRYADSEAWCFDFAPHDAGTYPLVNGQVYSNGTDPKDQMPIEECGNMLITVAALCNAQGNYDYAKENIELLHQWAQYLISNGADPENQLCTDDFAGHLAHNCNLSVKAIMGIASYGIIMQKLYGDQESELYFKTAKEMALSWMERASNGDGTFRLTFDQPDTFSMKYNLVWDIIFKTEIFPKEVIEKEAISYLARMDQYGMPLDSRAHYTKSDWLVWCGALMSSQKDFEAFMEPLWRAYHESESRVPMSDWYDTNTSKQVGFQHRSVQGGLYIRLLIK
jgi:hypothetical protein